MGCSSSPTAPAWELPTGCSPSRIGCSSVGPPQGHKPCQQTCSGVGSFPHRATGPARSLLQRGLSMGSQPPLGIHLLQHEVLRGMHVDICSTVDIHGLQGATCLTMVFPMGCRAKISAPAPGAPPPPPSSLTLVPAELFLSHILTLSCCKMPSHRGFCSLLNMLSQRCYHHH